MQILVNKTINVKGWGVEVTRGFGGLACGGHMVGGYMVGGHVVGGHVVGGHKDTLSAM